jgi:hypothetical protein
MWLFTTSGFLSIVEHRDDQDRLLVRARVREDLEPLAEGLGAELRETPAGDYRFRVEADREAVALLVADAVRAVDYPNFKNAVADRQGYARAGAYGRIWEVMFGVQQEALR